MSKSIAALIMALLFSLAGCVVFIYLWVDRSISLSYMESAYFTEKRSTEVLQELMSQEWLGLSEGEMMKKMEEMASRSSRAIVIKKEGSAILLDEISFHMKNGRLERVGTLVK